ncbi:aspartate aminotransferase family protein [Halogeometricum borinquense]|uniref:Aspartate aminotransferase family protein n=1 Tax=Halogeometricum borinquense TaxID=60847 RepID=A0A482T9T7_9EURY|nr:aspartate aminotransferase family protein [Halogeometricum borinquense]RYJ07713.1 aspartate aminotransferase family protein [Halogeometricum borinquense]
MSFQEAEGNESAPDGTATDAVDGQTLAERMFIGTPAGNDAYIAAIDRCRDAVLSAVGEADRPYSGSTYAEHRERLTQDTIPESGREIDEVIEDLATDVLEESVYPSDEACSAHLQCPPMVPSLAAEVVLSALNQSMDSFDQAPAATVLEEQVIDDLTSLFGLGDGADGVFTSGGTQSNLQGLLLAREHYVAEVFDRSVRTSGLPPTAEKMRILTSEDAHFTVAQAAAQLGLGEDAVVTVPTGDAHQMDPDELADELARLKQANCHPFALVGTAGTTDFGSVDPLNDLADLADEHDLWFHVDAALGGALALSETHAGKLDGIERADSLTVDFHKLLYQPISCGVFLLSDGDKFELMGRNAAYLNPKSDQVSNLVSKSLQTTRRFDALKPYVAFRTLGREGMAALVDRTVTLADRAASLIRSDPGFELSCPPTINIVTFRYTPERDHPARSPDEWADRINRRARDRLLASGCGVVARTEVDGCVHLKLTLMNPRTTVADIRELLLTLKGYATQAETKAISNHGIESDDRLDFAPVCGSADEESR